MLAVDDNTEALDVLDDVLKSHGFDVITAQSGKETLARVEAYFPDIILLDVQMPAPDGHEVTRILKADERYRYIPIVLLTGKDGLEDIVEGLDCGADDYIKKPYNQLELIARVRANIRTRAVYQELKNTIARNADLRRVVQDRFSFGNIIGRSDSMQEVFHTIEKISESSAPVLIGGESGTGKELVAHAIHFNSPRKDKPFVAQNVSAFNDNLLESELFGHVKGAFTGAIKDKTGLFQAADGGTLFLDELGEMSAAMQAKLLRVLQDGTLSSVGDTKIRKVDVRVIGATHRDLGKMVREGTFREDLFYRLNVIYISLPPLRERTADIPLLAEFFLEQSLKRNNISVKKFHVDTLKLLSSYTWPGNVRQLQNEIERLVLLSGKLEEIPPEVVSKELRQVESSGKRASADIGKLKDAVEALERAMITSAMEKFDGNKSEVARELGVSRSNLISKVQSYQLEKK